ncbi:MAG: MFS transporter, partial [Pseudomonadota bacterium]
LSYGLPGVALMLFIGFGLILYWSIAVRERAGEKVLPWTAGEPTARSLSLKAEGWGQITKDLFKVLFLPASLLLLGASFLFRFADGFWITLAPIIVVQELGYQSTDYSSFTAITGPIAAVAGLLLGPFIDRKGVKIFYVLTMALYGALAMVVGLSQGAWISPQFLMSVGVLQAFIYQGVFISFIAIHMNLCWVKVSATQFALYMAWVNLARSLGAGALGGLQPWLSYNQMFFVVGIAFFIAAALVSRVNLATHRQKVQVLEQEAL